LTDSYNFPTEEIMGAHNFYFAFEFLQNNGFLNSKFSIFGRKFSYKKQSFWID